MKYFQIWLVKNKILFITSSMVFLSAIAFIHILKLTPIISYTVIFIFTSLLYLFISGQIFKTEILSKNIYLFIFLAFYYA